MMWLARYCENMTKKAIAKEKEQKALASANEPAPIAQNPNHKLFQQQLNSRQWQDF